MLEIDERRLVRDLHRRVLEACQSADAAGKGYVAFQRWGAENVRLCPSWSHWAGCSSARLGLSIEDWAENAMYRLQEEGFIDRTWDLEKHLAGASVGSTSSEQGGRTNESDNEAAKRE